MKRLLAGAVATVSVLGVTTSASASSPGPGRNGAIAFHRADGFIYSVKPDGTGLKRLAAGAEAAYSPSGKRIAYVANGDIWSMRSDGTDRQRLTATPESESGPTWSPDGRRIAFMGYLSGTAGIYATRSTAPAGRPVRLMRTPVEPNEWTYSSDSSPAWASDGLIYFSRYTDYIGSMCDDGLETLSLDPVTEVVKQWRFLALDPDPAPRAKAVVYQALHGPDSCNLMYGIAIANADGSNPRAVTPPRAGTPIDREPAFSPDATRIAFQRGRYVMTVDADGSGLRRLVVGSAPTWQPLP